MRPPAGTGPFEEIPSFFSFSLSSSAAEIFSRIATTLEIRLKGAFSEIVSSPQGRTVVPRIYSAAPAKSSSVRAIWSRASAYAV